MLCVFFHYAPSFFFVRYYYYYRARLYIFNVCKTKHTYMANLLQINGIENCISATLTKMRAVDLIFQFSVAFDSAYCYCYGCVFILHTYRSSSKLGDMRSRCTTLKTQHALIFTE